MDDERKDEPIGAFDETNGEAPGLDGDDGGVAAEKHEKHGVLTDLVEDFATDFHDRDPEQTEADTETPYGEEGRP